MKTENETERLIFESVSSSPAELRQQLAQLVKSRVRRQTLINDCQWLGTTFGTLLIVAMGFWFFSRSAQTQLHEFCRKEISSAETARVLFAYLENSKSNPSQTMAPQKPQDIPGT